MEKTELLKSRFKKLGTIFWAMLLGELLLYGIATLWLVQNGSLLNAAERGTVIEFWLPVAAIAMIPLSYMVYSNRTKAYRESEDLSEKLESFFTSSVIRYIILDVAGLLTIVSYLFTYSRQGTYMFVAVVVIFLLQSPGAGRFINDLKVTGEDKELTENTLRRRKGE